MRLSSGLLLCAAPLLVAAQSLRGPDDTCDQCAAEEEYCACTFDGRCPEDSRCEMMAMTAVKAAVVSPNNVTLKTPADTCDQCAAEEEYCACTFDGRCPEDSRCEM